MIEIPPEMLRCSPETAAAIREKVRAAPRLTAGQKARLAALLAPPPRADNQRARESGRVA